MRMHEILNERYKWDQEKIDTLKQMYDAGESNNEIANYFGLSTGSIEQALIRFYSDRKKRIHQWTKEDIDTLKRLHDEGMSDNEIADHFGLSKGSIIQALVKYYSDRKKRNYQWTEEDIKTLKRLYDAGIDLIDIATHFGVSIDSIYTILFKFYHDRKKRNYQWTEEDIKTLKRLHDEGVSNNEIADHFGLSTGKIEKALKRYYSDRKKIEKIPWNETQIKELGELLDQGFRAYEIAKKLKRTRSSVLNALDKYYHDRKKRRNILWNEEEIFEIRELYKKGYGPTYISYELNKAFHSVFYLIKKQKDYETALLPPHLEKLQQLHGTSHIEIDFFNALETELKTRFHNRNIKIKRNHDIPREGKRLYNVDGIEQTQKLAIEFFGTLWHADPVVYPNPDQYLTKLSCTAGEVRDYDGKKIAWLAKTLGKSPVIIWEREWMKKSTKQECIDRVLSALGLI